MTSPRHWVNNTQASIAEKKYRPCQRATLTDETSNKKSCSLLSLLVSYCPKISRRSPNEGQNEETTQTPRRVEPRYFGYVSNECEAASLCIGVWCKRTCWMMGKKSSSSLLLGWWWGSNWMRLEQKRFSFSSRDPRLKMSCFVSSYWFPGWWTTWGDWVCTP